MAEEIRKGTEGPSPDKALQDAALALARRLRAEGPVLLPFPKPSAPGSSEPTATGPEIPSPLPTVHQTLSGPPPPSPALPNDLESLARVVQGCRRCRLHADRTHTVFGEGPTGCDVMFVGEGPGAEEDATGRPFVGPAGQLLDRMIAAMGLTRAECYISNVVKCRPPFNATPRPDEVGACRPYLERQIALVRPRVLVALGRTAAIALTGRQDAVARLRGTWFHFRVPDAFPPSRTDPGDIPVLVTYHPAALLRNPDFKPHAWRDLQLVMARLGRPVPRKGDMGRRDDGR